MIASSNGLELKSHGTPDFPVGYLSPHLFDFLSACVKPHWHPEIEIIHAIEGGMRILVNHENFYLRAGDCVVFNKNAVHSQEMEHEDCLYEVFNFDPVLIYDFDGSAIARQYTEPVCGSAAFPFCLFSGEDNANKSEFCRLFKATLHQTPFDFLLHYRIQQSLPLLCRPELSLTEIASAVGFSGASYYSEVFRKYTSCSPTEYRKRMLGAVKK